MRLDQVDAAARRGKRETRDRVVQRGRDRVRRRLAGPLAVEHIAPPLQPDLARHRLAHAVAHAGDLGIEGVEREQRTALLGGRKQRREKAVLVGGADQVFAMAIVLHAARR